MNIFVEQKVKIYFKFNFERNITNFLKYVPEDHLINLQKIEVIFSDYRNFNSGAYYLGNLEHSMPTIVICPAVLFEKMPRLLFFILPFIPKFLLASALYHEIGHHYQRLSHGIKKDKWESNAENYSRIMMKKAFNSYRLLLLLLFGPILFIRKICHVNTDNKRNSGVAKNT